VLFKILKVHPGVVVADISDCIDCLAKPWCWCQFCQWLYKWLRYTPVLVSLMSVVV